MGIKSENEIISGDEITQLEMSNISYTHGNVFGELKNGQIFKIHIYELLKATTLTSWKVKKAKHYLSLVKDWETIEKEEINYQKDNLMGVENHHVEPGANKVKWEPDGRIKEIIIRDFRELRGSECSYPDCRIKVDDPPFENLWRQQCKKHNYTSTIGPDIEVREIGEEI